MNLKIIQTHLAIVLAIFCFSFTAAAEEQLDPWSAPGQLVRVGKHQLHIFCQGEKNNKPTIIIDSGLGGFSLEWRKIQQDLSSKFHICSYDRAGYGWSEAGPFPRTSDTIVVELRKLLQGAEIAPPYLLMGHSFGGYNMMYFAKAHPQDVAGLILIDSSHPDQSNWFPVVFPELPKKGRTWFISIPKLPNNFPFDYRAVGYHLMSARKATKALRFESISFEKSGELVGSLGPFPNIPLVVLTRGERAWPKTEEGEKMEAIWIRLQNELAQMSENSVHIMATDSGHYIHLDQPILVEKALTHLVEDQTEE